MQGNLFDINAGNFFCICVVNDPIQPIIVYLNYIYSNKYKYITDMKEWHPVLPEYLWCNKLLTNSFKTF